MKYTYYSGKIDKHEYIFRVHPDGTFEAIETNHPKLKIKHWWPQEFKFSKLNIEVKIKKLSQKEIFTILL